MICQDDRSLFIKDKLVSMLRVYIEKKETRSTIESETLVHQVLETLEN